MKRNDKFRMRRLAVLVLALGCGMGWVIGGLRNMRSMTELEKLVATKKTICVGRYLLDVPAEARVVFAGGMIDGFDISIVEETERMFRKRVAGRAAAIETNGAQSGPRGPGGIIEAHELRLPELIGRSFVFGRTLAHGVEGERHFDSEFVSVEAHGHIDGLSVILRMDTAYPSDIKAAESLLARLRLRSENERTTPPGFCVAHAVFAEPLPIHTNEHMVMRLDLPSYPDLSMTLFSIAGGRSEQHLLARIEHTDATTSIIEKLRVTKLRSQKRNINGMNGEEEVERVREQNFTTGYSFTWEAAGVEDDVLFPYLSFEMETGDNKRPGGQPTQTRLREVALLALWDNISSSIRLRKVDPKLTIPMADSPSHPTPQAPESKISFWEKRGVDANAAMPAKPSFLDAVVNLVQY